jgi:hypothetical protein
MGLDMLEFGNSSKIPGVSQVLLRTAGYALAPLHYACMEPCSPFSAYVSVSSLGVAGGANVMWDTPLNFHKYYKGTDYLLVYNVKDNKA